MSRKNSIGRKKTMRSSDLYIKSYLKIIVNGKNLLIKNYVDRGKENKF